MKRFLPLVGAFLFASIVCSTAFAMTVGSRHQAEAMTDLGDPAWAITEKDDGTADDGTHISFSKKADSADKVRLSVSPDQQVNEISIRARLSGRSAGDDSLTVWVDGTAAANKVGTVLPSKGKTWATQTLSLSTPIGSGSHTIYFGPNQANDAFIAFDWAEFHNTGATPPPETTPPAAPTITEGTAKGSTDTDGMVDFAWTGAEASGSFECSLDTGTPSYSACVSPKHYMGYPDGTYSFRVRQIDDAGNVGAAATRGFVSQTDTGGTSGDTDTDGISDANESCDMQWGPRANNGCPYAQSQDYDFDGILDANDPITGRESQDTGFGSKPRIKANCDVYAVNRVDPIAFAHHLHNQIGNTTTTNQSTGQSLFEAGRGTTSCDMPWLTSAGWFPVIENEPVKAVNMYYRAPGDERYVQNLPVGTELLTPNQSFRCNTGAGEEPFQETPDVIYECTGSFGIRLDFPDCIDLRYLYDHTRNAVKSNRGVCPSTHPYRIPHVNQLTMYANANGSVPNPLRVSAGVDEWGDWTSLHGDYFAAVQPEFNQTTEFGPSLIQYCIRESRGSATGPERCGQGN